jgi:hypothetical protein
MAKKPRENKAGKPRPRPKVSGRNATAKRAKPAAAKRPPADDIAGIRQRLKTAILELDRKAPAKP